MKIFDRYLNFKAKIIQITKIILEILIANFLRFYFAGAQLIYTLFSFNSYPSSKPYLFLNLVLIDLVNKLVNWKENYIFSPFSFSHTSG